MRHRRWALLLAELCLTGTAWAQDKSFDVPASDAVHAIPEFARYSSTPIIIDDPAIAERTVTGLFSANNPVGFAQAVATSMNLTVDVESSGVRLSR